jgi:hypothetical protein
MENGEKVFEPSARPQSFPLVRTDFVKRSRLISFAMLAISFFPLP